MPRFNERFLLSLKAMPMCLMLDDTLDILPWARQTLHIEAVEGPTVCLPHAVDRMLSIASYWPSISGQPSLKFVFTPQEETAEMSELKELKQSLADTQPAGSLVGRAATMDQASALLKFIEAISEKTLRSTVVLTAARGRGKSATMGLAVAGAVAYGYAEKL